LPYIYCHEQKTDFAMSWSIEVVGVGRLHGHEMKKAAEFPLPLFFTGVGRG
jgi:hypothetical protein